MENVEFNFSYAPGITEEQIIGVELAGEMWSNYLGDTHQTIKDGEVIDTYSTVINIHVEIGSELLPENVIGGAFPAVSDKYKYEYIYDAIKSDITSNSDRLAADSLIDGSKANVLVNGEIIKNEKFQITTANLKALNIIDSNSDEGDDLDGYILMSDLNNFNTVEWNYDYLGGPKEGTLDFLSTITHEIGHALGFISGADRITSASEILNSYMNSASVDIIEQAVSIRDYGGYFVQLDDSVFDSDDDIEDETDLEFEEFDGNYSRKDRRKFDRAIENLQSIDITTDPKVVEDSLKTIRSFLKRDDEWKDFIEDDTSTKDLIEQLNPDKINSQELAEKMTSLDLFRYSNESSGLGANELTRGASTYFSLDGSQTDLAMSNGRDYQGSHWQDREQTEGLGIMNPTVALNERWEISSNDLMAMDAIGWDVNYERAIDLQALYNKASAAVDSALISDRQDDVDDILDGDAYERRRSRTSRTSTRSYRMSVDGYFSTFSEPVPALAEDSSNEVVAQIDDWLVVSNRDNRAVNNIVSVAPANSLVDSAKSVSKVEADYLQIDNSGDRDDLLQEIKANLDTGLEIALASSVL